MYRYRCDGCGLTLERNYRPRVYVLPDGREVAMAQRHVWCEGCATVTPAESLAWPADDLLSRPEDEADEAAWRALRTRPPRCLRCGAGVALPASDITDLTHPRCGTLRVTVRLLGGTFARCQPHRYSVEGDLLEQGVYFAAFVGQTDRPLELW